MCKIVAGATLAFLIIANSGIAQGWDDPSFCGASDKEFLDNNSESLSGVWDIKHFEGIIDIPAVGAMPFPDSPAERLNISVGKDERIMGFWIDGVGSETPFEMFTTDEAPWEGEEFNKGAAKVFREKSIPYYLECDVANLPKLAGVFQFYDRETRMDMRLTIRLVVINTNIMLGTVVGIGAVNSLDFISSRTVRLNR